MARLNAEKRKYVEVLGSFHVGWEGNLKGKVQKAESFGLSNRSRYVTIVLIDEIEEMWKLRKIWKSNEIETFRILLTFAFENNEMKGLFYFISPCKQFKYVSILYGKIYQTKEFLWIYEYEIKLKLDEGSITSQRLIFYVKYVRRKKPAGQHPHTPKKPWLTLE